MQHLRKFNENRKPKGYWSYENVKEEALRFKSRNEFRKNSLGAYSIAHKNGWLDDVCSHMNKPYVWTFDKVKEEALKFNKRSDFKMNSLAYSVATRRGWLDDVCSHMTPQGNLYKKHIYKVLFTDNSIYIGLTYNFDKRINDHLTSNKSSVYKHMIKTGLKPEFSLITKELLSNEDAVKMECNMINYYRDLGFNILNAVKGGALGGCLVIWDYDNIRKEALKFKTRGEFQKNSGRAYAVARNNGWLDDFCSHMTKVRFDKGYWSIDRVKEEALKFNTKVEFKDKSINAYTAAKRNGWLDDVCLHMTPGKRPNGYWTIDKVREEAKKFNSRSEFKRKSGSAYSYALKNGWLDDVCSDYTNSTFNK